MSSSVLQWFLELETSGLESASKKAEKSLHHLTEGAHEQFRQLIGPILEAAAAVGSITAVMSGVHGALDLGADLATLSEGAGAAVGELYDLRAEFADARVDAEKLGESMTEMKKRLAGSTTGGGQSSLLHAMGLDAQTLANEDPAKAFQQIGHAIHELKNPSEQAAAATELFGKKGGDLLKIFNSPEFAQGNHTLSATGKILEENAGAFDAVNKSIEHVDSHWKEFFVGFTSAAAPSWVKQLEDLDKVDLSGIGVKLGNVLGNFHTNAQDEWKRLGDDLSKVVGVSFSGDGVKWLGLELLIQASKFKDGLLNAFREPLDYFAARIEKNINMLHDALAKPISRADYDRLEKMKAPIRAGMEKADQKLYDLQFGSGRGVNPFSAEGHANEEQKKALIEEISKRRELIAQLEKEQKGNRWDTKSTEEIAADNKANGTDAVSGIIAGDDQARGQLQGLADELAKSLGKGFSGIKFSSFGATPLTELANALGRGGDKKAPNGDYDAGNIGAGHTGMIASSLARVGGGGAAALIGSDPLLREAQRQNALTELTNTHLENIYRQAILSRPFSPGNNSSSAWGHIPSPNPFHTLSPAAAQFAS